MSNPEIHICKRTGEKYYKYLHKSGLVIYFHPKDFVTYYASLTVRFGSLCRHMILSTGERLDIPIGTAHFLEHKLFEMEDGGDAFERFAKIGGDANAYTTKDYTSYIFSCTDNFTENLRILLDFVYHPHFTAENLARERSIIAEEIKMNADDPLSRGYQGVRRSLFPNHPMVDDTCGTENSIAEITPELLYKCHGEFYVPSNMFLTVSGDTDIESIISVVDELLPEVQSGKVGSCNDFDYVSGNICHEVTEYADISIPIIFIAFKDNNAEKDPHEREKRANAISMIGDLLFGVSSEFHYRMYSEGIISSEMSFFYDYGADYAFYTINFASQHREKALLELKSYLGSISEHIPNEQDFLRIKKVRYANSIFDFDSTEYIVENTVSNVFWGLDNFEVTDIIEEIDYNYIIATLSGLFDLNDASVSSILPKGDKNA